MARPKTVLVSASKDLWADVFRATLEEDAGISDISSIWRMSDFELRKMAKAIRHPFWSEAFNTLARVKQGFHISNVARFKKLEIAGTSILWKTAGTTFSTGDISWEGRADRVLVSDILEPETLVIKPGKGGSHFQKVFV